VIPGAVKELDALLDCENSASQKLAFFYFEEES
jgi:hypothetical protein